MGQRDIERLCLEYAQNPEVQDLLMETNCTVLALLV